MGEGMTSLDNGLSSILPSQEALPYSTLSLSDGEDDIQMGGENAHLKRKHE